MIKQSWLNWRKLIIDDTSLTSGEKYIGLYLNTYMNDSHDFAFPSISKICGETSLSNKTAIKHIQGLSEKGFLQKTKRFSNSTIYHATIPRSVEITLMEELHHRSVETTPTEVEKLHSNKQENKQSNKQVSNTRKKTNVFIPPKLSEIIEYAKSRNNLSEAQKFYDYFEAGDWKDAYGKKVISWKQKFITWSGRNNNNQNNREPKTYEPFPS